MISLTSLEAERRFDELLDRVVADGEEIVITNDGRPIARIVPERKLTDDEIRSAIEEGRL